MSELPSVRLTGGPTERGRTHGETFAEAIRRNVSTYMERFEHNDVPEAEVRGQAAEFLSEIEDWNPAYAAELRGVADLTERSLRVARGPPYESSYRTHRLD